MREESILEPGFIPVLVPPAASHPLPYYVESSDYMGQPLGTGVPIALYAWNYDVAYQAGDLSRMTIPHLKMDDLLREATWTFKKFVLVGRLVFPDALFRPNESEIAADLSNQALGEYGHEIRPYLNIYECLYLDKDLMDSHRTKRLMAAEEIVHWLRFHGGVSFFRYITPAVTTKEKEDLSVASPRILWAKWTAPYRVKEENYVYTQPE